MVGPELIAQRSRPTGIDAPRYATALPTRRSEITAQLNRETHHQIRTVKPSVVSIYSSAVVVDPATGLPQEGQIAGSGFVVPWEREDGKIVIATNRHVIEAAKEDPGSEVVVRTSSVAPDGSDRSPALFSSAELIYASPRADVAFIAIDPSEHPEVILPPVTFGSISDVHEGYRIAAVGDPYGFLDETSGVGHVANEGLKMAPTEFGTYPVFQVDAQLRQGDSGGVVINLEDGKVIGVPNIQINDPSTGLAMPIEIFAEEMKMAQKTEQYSDFPTYLPAA